MPESGVSKYIKGWTTVTANFPVDLKGNKDISCVQCEFYRRSTQRCGLNDAVCEYPTKYISSHCPLSFEGDAYD